MAKGKRNTTPSAPASSQVDRYRPALTYVELDRRHRKRSKWSTVLAVALFVLAASLAALGVIGFSYYQGQQKYDHIAQVADLGHVEQGQLDDITIDWDALSAINPDTVGWLYIPGTSINYPIVQGDDNEYYLTHDFEKVQGMIANFGAVFLDWRNSPDWTDEAYFIYGHHMNDGSMFADIAGLADQERFDASRTVYLLSPHGNFQLRSFTLIHCAADEALVQSQFATPAEMSAYIEDKIRRSIVDVGDIPGPAEIKKLFAFATCDNFSSGRYVLYAYVQDEVGTSSKASSAIEVKDESAQATISDLLVN